MPETRKDNDAPQQEKISGKPYRVAKSHSYVVRSRDEAIRIAKEKASGGQVAPTIKKKISSDSRVLRPPLVARVVPRRRTAERLSELQNPGLTADRKRLLYKPPTPENRKKTLTTSPKTHTETEEFLDALLEDSKLVLDVLSKL